MLTNFLNKFKNLILTLRVSILSIFVTLFFLATLSLIFITYFRFSSAMSFTARQLMQQVSTSIFKDISHEFSRIKLETQMSARIIQEGLIDYQNKKQISKFIFSMMNNEMRTMLSAQSTFFSDTQGNFVISARLDNERLGSEILKRTTNTSSRTAVLYDLKGNFIKDVALSDLSYNPLVRPWYLAAKQFRTTVTTDPYQYRYFGPKYWGITVATPAINKQGELLGVVGINVPIAFLRHFIERIKVSPNSIIFIVSSDGTLIAMPKLEQYDKPKLLNIHQLSNRSIIESFDNFRKNNVEEFEFTSQNQNYLATYKPIEKVSSHTWYLVIVAPQNDFIGVLKKTNYITIGLSLLIILLGLWIVSKLVTKVVHPMKLLLKETEKIKNFELGQDIRIFSHIKEVIHLTRALNSMKKGLKLFQKFVPAHLVRQLIEADEVGAGGTKKSLVVFFSDINNFTSIAEHLDADRVMEQMCEYFDELSRIISDQNGTIDKYIGDSIMAFWGAPLLSEMPEKLAVLAALRCQKRLVVLNSKWNTQGKPSFETRIGIHKGDAIVGNVGSADRLNYTALGDTINLTSRLEAINKIYATNIIVSETIYENIKDQFSLRFLDCVSLKGKEKSICIYELMAESYEPLPFDLSTYNQTFLTAFSEYKIQNWDLAIQYFAQCLEIFPTDSVAPIFISRCQSFKQNPPPENWDGVWHFNQK